MNTANSNGFFSTGFDLLFLFFVDPVDAVAALNRSFLLSLRYNPLFVLVCIMDLARSKVSATEPEAIVGEAVFELELLRTLNSTSEASFSRSAAFLSFSSFIV